MADTIRHKRQLRPTIAFDFPVIDGVMVVVTAVLLVAFFVFPWMSLRDGTSYTAFDLLTGAQPDTAIADYLGIPLLMTLIVGGLAFASIIGRLPTILQRQTAFLTVLCGLGGLAYFAIVIVGQRGQSIDDVRVVTGDAFWWMMAASIFFIAQAMVPRRFMRHHLERPVTRDGERLSYQRWFFGILHDDMFQRNFNWLVMTLPALIWLFVFKYLTMYGLLIAFQDYKPRRGIEGSDFVGLDNFDFLFATDVAIRAFRNTIALNLLFIAAGTIFSLFVAFLIFEVYSAFVTRFYQAALLLPNFISWVIVSYFVFALLETNGLVNSVLDAIGIEPVRWYSSPEFWPGILLMANLWHSVGWGSLIYLSGMLAIDPQLFEAARIDGAGKWTQWRRITLPLILPLVVIQVLLALGHIFSADFGLFYQVTRDKAALYETTDVLDTFIYRSLTGSASGVKLAAAAQFFQSMVGFVLVLFANWFVKRISPPDEDLSLF